MDLPIDLPGPLAWLVDEAGASPGPDRFLAELGGRLLADGLPLAGGALTGIVNLSRGGILLPWVARRSGAEKFLARL